MRSFFSLALAASTILAAQPAIAADINSVPLIERTKLFGNPVKANGQISPADKWLS